MFEATESAREALRNEPVLDWDLFERCAREVASRRIKNQDSEILKVLDEKALELLSEHDLKDQMEVSCKIDPAVARAEHDRVKRRVQNKRKESTKSDAETLTMARHNIAPTTAIFQPLWTTDEVKEAQENDPDVSLLYRHKVEGLGKPTPAQISGGSAAMKAYFRDWSFIEVREGLLYRYYEDATRAQAYYRLLIPQCYQQRIIEGSHEQGIACHQGYRRTFENLRLRYDWHDMRCQLRVYTRACAVCQRKRSKNVNTKHSSFSKGWEVLKNCKGIYLPHLIMINSHM